MEENQTSTSTQDKSNNSKKWVIIAVVGIIVILIAAGGGFLFLNTKEGSISEEMMEGQEEIQTSPVPKSEPEAMVPGNYKDGTYSAVGTYAYHAGTESIGVTVTLSKGVIESVSVEEMAKAPMSKQMQDDFAANFKSEVVGKNIDEVKLGKISGSSLTPIGFNTALEDIKAKASAS